MRPIFLIGYMGSGKTTLGRAFAKARGVEFIDLDHYIERRYHANVRDIFNREGEAAFRDKERRMLREVADFEDVVVACGGGTPCYFDNIEHMNRSGVTVWLDATFDVNYRRLLAGRYKRPTIAALGDEELAEFMRRAMAERRQYYSQARVRYCSDNLESTEGIARSVAELTEIIENQSKL